MTPELQHKIAVWRQKCADNTITQEEMKAAVLELRAGRVTAQAASTASRAKAAKKEIPKAADLLGELGQM